MACKVFQQQFLAFAFDLLLAFARRPLLCSARLGAASRDTNTHKHTRADVGALNPIWALSSGGGGGGLRASRVGAAASRSTRAAPSQPCRRISSRPRPLTTPAPPPDVRKAIINPRRSRDCAQCVPPRPPPPPAAGPSKLVIVGRQLAINFSAQTQKSLYSHNCDRRRCRRSRSDRCGSRNRLGRISAGPERSESRACHFHPQRNSARLSHQIASPYKQPGGLAGGLAEASRETEAPLSCPRRPAERAKKKKPFRNLIRAASARHVAGRAIAHRNNNRCHCADLHAARDFSCITRRRRRRYK